MDRIFRILPLLLALLPLAALAQDDASPRQPIDEIVAVVDEEVILRSELEAAITGVVRQVEARGERLPPRSVLEEQVLERLIMNQVQIQRAEQTGIRMSDQDVDRALGDLARQNGLTLTQLRAAIEGDGLSFDEFRQEIRSELTTQALRRRIVDGMDEITDTEIDIMLASDNFRGDEYKLSQILIQVPESAGPDELDEAAARADEAYRELQDGLEFASAAIAYSDAPDALEGGDVGWRNLNALPRQIADVIRDLEPGQYTEPLRIQSGFIIARVDDRRAQREVIVTEYRMRHLMVRPSELLPAEEARELIESLHDRLEAGEDFGEIAREFSDDQGSANLGGMIDWFPEGAYGTGFQNVIDSLAIGQMSEVFQSPQGWHVIRLEDQREADRTVESMRNEAREMIIRQKADDEIERVLRRMRSEAYVDIRL
ncbi:molecular chaperone SurA [Wenzhouxiangella sp. XN79A]|uniref:peptidylprolyl isomerase n=1 Tax=Wenzhouxiangella sp. XN79A TaxID=2724193 RepID=UPI00144ACC84|nr:peptidylprolyl isomerase [Wenzhouxiangella sp. XN79A]NKI34277.1 molecular chaperone SurA [Wenzhouxiangella sp. XN79A]